jgi:hypothetical protein
LIFLLPRTSESFGFLMSLTFSVTEEHYSKNAQHTKLNVYDSVNISWSIPLIIDP